MQSMLLEVIDPQGLFIDHRYFIIDRHRVIERKSTIQREPGL
jgi:hypothetical protein